MHESIEMKNGDILRVGANITLIELEETLKHYIKTKPGNILNLLLYLS